MIIQCVVRWQDGSHDSNRICELCHKFDCKYPVYKDFYKEVKVGKREAVDPPIMTI